MTSEDPFAKDRRFAATVEFGAEKRRFFKTKAGAERWAARMKAKFVEAKKLADGEIWTSIELIYLTRWDCPIARLAAA